MPWNEPGNQNSGDKKPNNNKPGGNKPPEFDQILSDLFKSIKRTFGFGTSSGSSNNNSQAPIVILLLGLLGLGVYSSAYQIEQAERENILTP